MPNASTMRLNHSDHWSIASLTMSQPLFRTCYRRSMTFIFWWYASCWRAPQRVLIIYGIQIRWTGWQFGSSMKSVLYVCFNQYKYNQYKYTPSCWYITITVFQIPLHTINTAMIGRLFGEHFRANSALLWWMVQNMSCAMVIVLYYANGNGMVMVIMVMVLW